jgi:hypothetical protein
MSTVKSPELVPDQGGFEIDMRNLLQDKRASVSGGGSNESEGDVGLASMISQISFQSIQEIDRLIDGLQGIRRKLDDDGDRIQREIAKYASFSHSIVDLTKIVTDGMTSIARAVPEKVIELQRANPPDLNRR